MWIPKIIAITVMFITVKLITILESKEIIKKRTTIYTVIKVIGVYIPIWVITVYMKTDNLKETIIVTCGICFCIALYFLFFEILRKNKYNYILYLIINICCYFIIRYITPYMISDLESEIIGFSGVFLGVSCANNKYKGRLIIAGIIVGLIIMVKPIKELRISEINNKVESISIEYSENHGYDITNDDEVIIRSRVTRNKPIRLSIVKRMSSKGWELERELELIYLNGKIIELKEKE